MKQSDAIFVLFFKGFLHIGVWNAVGQKGTYVSILKTVQLLIQLKSTEVELSFLIFLRLYC